MPDQLLLTKRIKDFADSINGEGVELLINLKKLIYKTLVFKQPDKHERSIRWKRTADQILSDGYVYKGKACTDLVILFLALCSARGFQNRFVKLYNKELVHSVAEIKIGDDWYFFDIASKQKKPIKGQLKGWKVWKKGKDSWSIGLKQYSDIKNIKKRIISDPEGI